MTRRKSHEHEPFVAVKRKHRWQPIDLADRTVALKCDDCGIVQRCDTGEVYHRGSWRRVTVPRCGENIR